MQIAGQQPKSESILAALYERRARLVSRIQSIERYQRCTVPPHAQMRALRTADLRLRCNRAK